MLLRSGYPEENIRYHFYIDFETNVRPKDRTYTVKSKDYQKYPYEWFHKAILKNLKKANKKKRDNKDAKERMKVFCQMMTEARRQKNA